MGARRRIGGEFAKVTDCSDSLHRTVPEAGCFRPYPCIFKHFRRPVRVCFILETPLRRHPRMTPRGAGAGAVSAVGADGAPGMDSVQSDEVIGSDAAGTASRCAATPGAPFPQCSRCCRPPIAIARADTPHRCRRRRCLASAHRKGRLAAAGLIPEDDSAADAKAVEHRRQAAVAGG